jgi:hypothetical protein
MPLFQSDEGKFLSTKKISNVQKMQQIEQNQIEDKENDQESPQMPRLNTYEAKVMLSTKKPSSFKKQLSPETHETAKDNSFLMESPEMPIMKTINLKSVIQQAKGTYL